MNIVGKIEKVKIIENQVEINILTLFFYTMFPWRDDIQSRLLNCFFLDNCFFLYI